eukprot:4722935-Pleurochrysis_carterae.AAC.3
MRTGDDANRKGHSEHALEKDGDIQMYDEASRRTFATESKGSDRDQRHANRRRGHEGPKATQGAREGGENEEAAASKWAMRLLREQNKN